MANVACANPEETIAGIGETIFPLRRPQPETPCGHLCSVEFENEIRGHVVTSSFAKYLVIRTIAFFGLTAASTAVMALPYIA